MTKPKPKFVHIIWAGINKHSVEASSIVAKGEIKPGENVTAKWKGRSNSATIAEVDMC